ncbi:helix-turn-helix domain-containing protein [Thalassotalea psychrophila]|uniref:Helix-turn-helix domain-containing protein n=1 Tax=Thalassotalea psychrophila TaxID=3065647 RepID=A0ABY9TQL3_9GAMM|nr:helix-turn-helix domain-containing protein [Colwelliaceae bacterium SQ149]
MINLSFSSFTLFFALFAFAQIVMAFMLLLPKAKDNEQVKLYCALMLVAGFYLLPSIFFSIEPYNVIWWVTFFASNLLPGIFFLVGLSVFSDHHIIKAKHYGFAVTPAVILFIAKLLQIFGINQADLFIIVLINIALLVDIGLVCFALLFAIKCWRNDLVKERRIIRGAVISVTATYIILVIILGQVLQINWPWLNTFEMLMLAALISGLNFYLFTPKLTSLFEPPKSNQIEETPVEFKNELVKLKSVMTEECLYRQEGITISKLASHVAIQEYKLRTIINGALGYRNFNDFLNHYRITEVSEKLISETYKSTPILTLALDSGFRSLSSFNKAFKMTHNATPTEFRKNQSA